MKTLVANRGGWRWVMGTALVLGGSLSLLAGCVVAPLPVGPVVVAPRPVVVAPAPVVVVRPHRWGWHP